MTRDHSRRWRWLRRVAYGLAGFVLVFYMGGGLYFAEQIRADGLAAELPSQNHGVRVLSFDDDTITLDGSDRRAIEHDGTLGLRWSDGYGQVHTIRRTSGDEVTRDFALITGRPPPLCVSDASCVEVDLEGYAYPEDPTDVGLAFEEVTYETPLGSAPAWIVAPSVDATGTWAIHVHGWRAERREAVRMLPAYADSGVTSLVVEYRNGPGAPTDPSGLIRFGRTEWEDVRAAVAYAIGEGAERVVLVGYSTGAAAVMSFLEHATPEPGLVAGLVFDAPNIDFGRAVSVEAARRTIPGTPFTLPRSLTAVAKTFADLRYDVGWAEIDYVDHEGVLTVPTLVFHGADDQTVPLSVSEDLADRYPALVTLIVTPGADHVQSWNIDPGGYERSVESFLAGLPRAG